MPDQEHPLITALRNYFAPADPYAGDIAAVKQRYPLFRDLPIEVQREPQGANLPYQSEFYKPWDPENPDPGHNYVQFRHYLDQPRSHEEIQDLIAGEQMHYEGSRLPSGQPVNPEWYKLKEQIWKTMPPNDQRLSYQNWQREQQQAKPEDRRSFERYMNDSDLDQYIGGYMWPLNDEWRQRKATWAKRAPQQIPILQQLQQMLTGGNNASGK